MIDTKNFSEMVEQFHKKLEEVSAELTGIRPAEDSWSLKEIIGHLIDSTSNNHQRFVRLQFGDLLDFPPYEAESWLQAQNYRSMDWKELVKLWYSYNRILLRIIENIDENALENVWVKGEDALPLNFIVKDFYRHLQWHIGHFEGRLKEVQA